MSIYGYSRRVRLLNATDAYCLLLDGQGTEPDSELELTTAQRVTRMDRAETSRSVKEIAAE